MAALAAVRMAQAAAATTIAMNVRSRAAAGLFLRHFHTGSSRSRGFLSLVRPRLRQEHRAGAAAWRRFCVRAADVSGPGSVDSLIAGMHSKIKEQLKAQEVIVKDAYGDGRHVSIEVVAEAFEGQSAVNRQRMVYKAIWEELQNAVHAVDQLKTSTPAEAAKRTS